MTTPDPALVSRLRAAGCVFAEDEAALLTSVASGEALESLVVRRLAGEPLELVVGFAELGGVRVRVAPGVFVPRRRSELLVRLAVERLGSGGLPPGPVPVVDVGCGTGALAAAVLAHAEGVRAVEAWAVDVDPAAVACARLNLPPDRVLLGDLFAPLPVSLKGRVAVVLANAPYVPTAAIALMAPEAREHEHLVALDGGADGLDVQRRLVAEAPRWLAPGGTLLVESGRAQAPVTAGLMSAARLRASVVTDEEVDGTVVVGVRAG